MKLAETETGDDRETRARHHVRIRRAKQFLRPLPRKATIHRWPVLKWFANTARKRPYLWSFRVREVSIALYLGFVISFLPLPGIQFLIAFAAAWILRANLPIIMGAQLITNLATMWLIYPALGAFGTQLIDLFGRSWGTGRWHYGRLRSGYDLPIHFRPSPKTTRQSQENV